MDTAQIALMKAVEDIDWDSEPSEAAAKSILSALDAAGYVVVSKEPTEHILEIEAACVQDVRTKVIKRGHFWRAFIEGLEAYPPP